MVIRIWHGRTRAAVADEYLNYLNQTGVPDCRRTEGNRGVQILRRLDGDAADFLMITRWDSLASIERFAGESYQQARYYPGDARYLVELEPGVQHYECVLEEGVASRE